jgi:hypothetical protein
MNCRLDQVVRPEHVDVQNKLEGLEPVSDSVQSVFCHWAVSTFKPLK